MKNRTESDDYGSAENQEARLKESEYYKVMSNGNYEQVTCSQCNGSGEGMYEGEKCKTCKGSGIELVEIEKECTLANMDNQKCHAYNNGSCMNGVTCDPEMSEDEQTANDMIEAMENDMIEAMENDIDLAVDNDPELMSDLRPELG